MSFSKWPWPSKDRDRNRANRRKPDLDAFRQAPVDVLMKLDSDILYQLPIEVLERLPPEGLIRLPLNVLARLSPQCLARLHTEDLRRLPIWVLECLPPEVLERLPPDMLIKFSSEALNELPIDLLERLSPGGLEYLPPDVLARLSPQRLASLPLEHLRRLPVEKLVTLPPSTIAQLGPDVVRHLPIEVVLQLPPEFLAALPPARIEKLSPEALATLESLPPDVLNVLSNSTLCHLRPSILAHLSPERLPFLPVDILANLPWTTIVKLPSETLSRLPMSTLITLPPETLTNLDSDALSRLPAHVRQRIPAEPPQTELPSISHTVGAETKAGRAHEVPREQKEQAMGVAKRAMTKQIGRSKSVSLLSSSRAAHQPDPRTSANVDGPDPTKPPRPPQSNDIGGAPHKRASYRHLRHPSLESASQIGKNSASEKVGGGQSSDLKVVSPLGAVIAEARGLRRDSEGGRGRSSSLHRSSPQPQATQTSLESLPNESTVPSETRQGGPSNPAERQSPTGLAPGEKRVPSSGSQTSIARRGSLRQLQTDGQNKQIPAKEKQDMTHHSLQADQRAAPSERSRGTRYEPPRYQVATDAEIQLQTSLSERDRLIVELQAALDHETARAKEFKTCFEEATLLFEQQKNKYERELADLRNILEGEKAKQEQNIRLLKRLRDEQLAEQEHLHQNRMKELKSEILAQNSNWDRKLQEERHKLQQELAKADTQLDNVRRSCVVELERQKHDYLDQIASLQRETSKREEKHAGKLKSLQQEHRIQLDALTGKLETQRAAHDEQVDILTGQLQDQDGDYRKQIAQLNERHAHEIQKLRGSHQIETGAINDKSNAYAESLRRQYEDQVRLQRDHYQQQLQLLKDQHHNALQQQALEHSRMLDSLRAESGDFVRKASDDKLNAMFGQLKIAVEVVSEPFNLGRIAIQPGSPLDPAGFLQRERGMQRHLLRSLIWAKIAHGFFSAPFGFGVLGDGPGRQMLLELLFQWRRLLELEINNGIERLREASDALSDIHEMCRDRETNRWRSATFQSIMAIVTAKTRDPSSSETGKPDMRSQYAANRAKIQREIVDVLNEATNSRVAIEIEEKVAEITGLAGELALEMGVHRAYLGLEFPHRGDQVVIGPDFVDCEDGDPARGMLEEVDLVVCPRFFKIGDGRGDMTASKSIFRGEIYPKRE